MRIIPIIAGILVVVGCSRERTSKPAETASVAAADTAGCETVRVSAHPDPDTLIAEFVRRDGQGEFWQSRAWFDGAVDCPGHEEAGDMATEASEHRIHTLDREGDTVRAEVQWTRLGYFGPEGSREAPGREVDTLAAVRTAFGWRIASPALNPHVPRQVPKAKRRGG